MAGRLSPQLAYMKKYHPLGPRNRPSWGIVLLNDVLGPVCKKCGATTELVIDHIVPLSLGGPHTLSNLQVLCKDCHQKKTDQERKDELRNRLGLAKQGKRWLEE